MRGTNRIMTAADEATRNFNWIGWNLRGSVLR